MWLVALATTAIGLAGVLAAAWLPGWGSDLEWEIPPEWQSGAPDTLPGECSFESGRCAGERIREPCELAAGADSQRADDRDALGAPLGAPMPSADKAGKEVAP